MGLGELLVGVFGWVLHGGQRFEVEREAQVVLGLCLFLFRNPMH